MNQSFKIAVFLQHNACDYQLLKLIITITSLICFAPGIFYQFPILRMLKVNPIAYVLKLGDAKYCHFFKKLLIQPICQIHMKPKFCT